VKALTLPDARLPEMKRLERMDLVLQILILQALAWHAQGHTNRAVSVLLQALQSAEPEGAIRSFADEGPAMAGFLREAVTRGISTAYAARILAACPPEETPVRKPGVPGREELSRREMDGLRLIAAGWSNREIAERLALSTGTVKVHARNIFLKLGAKSRTQAVAKAKASGILSRTPFPRNPALFIENTTGSTTFGRYLPRLFRLLLLRMDIRRKAGKA
jgi:LuxR family maltose regulon positive regulatory protein